MATHAVIKDKIIMTEEKKSTPVLEEAGAPTVASVPEKGVTKTSALKDFFAEMDLMQADDSLESLLKAGAHFGHQKSRRHPRMMPYIYGVRGTVTIMDLAQTQKGIRDAQKFLASVRKSGKKILFVTTKKQMVDLIQSAAQRIGEPYVVGRWIGGTFTNFSQIRGRVRSLVQMEDKMEKGLFQKYTKFEQLKKQEEIEKLNRKMGGLKKMDELPGAIVIVDVKTDALAVAEARNQGIPVVAITDTNVDPRLVDYVIPANDDAISSVKLILSLLLKAVDVITPVKPQPAKRSQRSTSRNRRTHRASSQNKKSAETSEKAISK